MLKRGSVDKVKVRGILLSLSTASIKEGFTDVPPPDVCYRALDWCTVRRKVSKGFCLYLPGGRSEGGVADIIDLNN